MLASKIVLTQNLKDAAVWQNAELAAGPADVPLNLQAKEPLNNNVNVYDVFGATV